MKTLYSFVSLLVIMTTNLFAGDIDISSLPKLLGSNNMGKEFYFTFIPAWDLGWRSDLKLYITSNVKTNVTVEVEGKGYSKTKTTVPNDIIEFRLVPSLGQVYSKYQGAPPEPDQVWRDAGVHIKAEDPIICYGVTRYAYTSDGFLALPVNVLGKEYIVASYQDPSENETQWLTSYTGITAPYDDTEVSFTMGGNDSSSTAGGLLPGQLSIWKLNRGDVLLIGSLGQNAELTGSKIVATKPVSVVSGNFCAYIPTNCGCCDVIEEMELPIDSWGTEYHVTPILNRIKHSIIRIFAKEENTTIYRDNDSIGFILTPGGLSGIGWLDMRADTGLPRPVIIHAKKPISVTQYNTGQLDDSIVSDPFQMVLVPTEQYQKEMTFNTPGIRGGIGFPYNYINLCYEATAEGNIPDDLMFARIVGEEFEWSALKEIAPIPGQPFAKGDGGKNYYSKTILLPGDGVYKIKADKPFQAYSYGFSWCDSYGMPASVSLRRLDVNDTMPPEPAWAMDCDGDVNEDTLRFVVDKAIDMENISGLAMIFLQSDSSYNYKLSHGEFIAGEDSSTWWKLNVIDKSKDAFAKLFFIDRAGNDTAIRIQYNSSKLMMSDSNIYLRAKKTDTTLYYKFKLYNKSLTDTLILDNIYFSSDTNHMNDNNFYIFKKDSLTLLTYPQILFHMDSLELIFGSKPSRTGYTSDTIYADIRNKCSKYYLSKVYQETGKRIINVSDVNFPETIITNTSYASFYIRNLGDIDLKIYNMNYHFNQSLNLFSDSVSQIIWEDLLTIKPKDSIKLDLSFAPYDTTRRYFTINLNSNSDNDNYQFDSVCNIYAKGLYQPFSINYVNFGSIRVSSEIMKSEPVMKEIILKNLDTLSVEILSMFHYYPEHYSIDTNDFIGKVIQPNESISSNIYFHPQKYGEFNNRLAFKLNRNWSVHCNIYGIGTLGLLTIGYNQDYFWDTTLVNDFEHPNEQIARIYNSSSWDFADTIKIIDIIEEGVISSLDFWNDSTAFRYDKNSLNLPVTLAPGKSLDIDVQFVARKNGINRGSLNFVANSATSTTYYLSGYGKNTSTIDELNKSGFYIYPNPITNTFNLRYNIESSGMINIFLTNVLGNQTLLKTEYKFPGEYVETFNLNIHPQGIYNVVLQTENRNHSCYVIINR